VPLDPATCYRALEAHDARFDGVFFVAVTTTGIYCRPICPARVPAATRCVFFHRAAEAERAGFRACFRCRPELAPGLRRHTASVDAVADLATRAASRIDAGYLNEGSVDGLAAEFGVSARHLRRAMEAQLGVTPVELAQTKRLALAKHLLQETRLPLTEIAFAAGFASLRRFNALFQERFGRPPSALRRELVEKIDSAEGAWIALRLDYRPPFDWQAMLGFFSGRTVAGIEQVSADTYVRFVRLGDHAGLVRVRNDVKRNALRVQVSPTLAPVIAPLVARLRVLFDLDAQPTVIAEHLSRDPLLAPLVARRPGLRLPGAFDGFEMAVRAILGQQVSVAAATTICGRLVRRFGVAPPAAEANMADDANALGWQFPQPARLAQASVGDIAELGMPGARARTVLGFARAVSDGTVDLTTEAMPQDVIDRLLSLPGIGPWTANYIALRALRWPDAFPATDLGVRKALGVKTLLAAEQRAADWRPWRGYAVLHLWSSLATGG
jgi:AraC family transcriptional regulator of adaptative response / DNA-3-methyladenine glycosylase II